MDFCEARRIAAFTGAIIADIEDVGGEFRRHSAARRAAVGAKHTLVAQATYRDHIIVPSRGGQARIGEAAFELAVPSLARVHSKPRESGDKERDRDRDGNDPNGNKETLHRRSDAFAELDRQIERH
jgi:hypothetical protein